MFLLWFASSYCQKQMDSVCQEGARNHGMLNISLKDFLNLKAWKTLPRRLEETLDRINRKKEMEDRLLTLLLYQKRYLLNAMFIWTYWSARNVFGFYRHSESAPLWFFSCGFYVREPTILYLYRRGRGIVLTACLGTSSTALRCLQALMTYPYKKRLIERTAPRLRRRFRAPWSRRTLG